MEDEELDLFGALVMRHLRDSGFEFVDGLVVGRWKAPKVRGLQSGLLEADADCRDLAVRAARSAIDYAVHEFLFSLHEACERGDMEIKVRGKDIVALSDGLQGEPYTDEGWQARFSKYGESGDST